MKRKTKEGLDDNQEATLRAFEIAQESEPTEEEILYWATPYYDELQRQKELKNQQLKEQEQLHVEESTALKHDPDRRQRKDHPRAQRR